MKAIGEADFLFRYEENERLAVYYSCASADHVRLELRIAPNSAEWLVFVDPSIKRGKAAEFYQRPMMRMLLNNSGEERRLMAPGSTSPECAAVPIVIEGKGELEDFGKSGLACKRKVR